MWQDWLRLHGWSWVSVKPCGREQPALQAVTRCALPQYGERALLLAWCVQATAGPIGFAVQRKLHEAVTSWVPDGAEVSLMTDRFYDSADLIALCRAQTWGCALH